jgi:hypothetical protein
MKMQKDSYSCCVQKINDSVNKDELEDQRPFIERKNYATDGLKVK